MPKNIKNNTLKEILDIILYEAPSTQDEIAEKLNISRRYVTKLLKPLIDENVIKKAYVVDLKKFNEISENYETENSLPEYSGEYFIKEMMKEMGEQICKQFAWSFEALKNNDVDLAQKALDEFNELTGVLNIVNKDKKEDILDEEIEKLIEQRTEAKKNKNFQLADEIRQQLLDKGIILEDTRQGVKWKRA